MRFVQIVQFAKWLLSGILSQTLPVRARLEARGAARQCRGGWWVGIRGNAGQRFYPTRAGCRGGHESQRCRNVKKTAICRKGGQILGYVVYSVCSWSIIGNLLLFEAVQRTHQMSHERESKSSVLQLMLSILFGLYIQHRHGVVLRHSFVQQ
jgi:hypothetical protein